MVFTARPSRATRHESPVTFTNHELENLLAPALQIGLHFAHKLVGNRAIHDAVVVGQREIHHGAHGDGVVDHHGTLLNGSNSQDGYVRLVDYRKPHEPAINAWIGDGE